MESCFFGLNSSWHIKTSDSSSRVFTSNSHSCREEKQWRRIVYWDCYFFNLFLKHCCKAILGIVVTRQWSSGRMQFLTSGTHCVPLAGKIKHQKLRTRIFFKKYFGSFSMLFATSSYLLLQAISIMLLAYILLIQGNRKRSIWVYIQLYNKVQQWFLIGNH